MLFDRYILYFERLFYSLVLDFSSEFTPHLLIELVFTVLWSAWYAAVIEISLVSGQTSILKELEIYESCFDHFQLEDEPRDNHMAGV